MKNFSIVLIASFAVFQLGTADNKHVKECLVEHGFNESDISLLESIGSSNGKFLNDVKNVSRDKVACVLACIFRKETPEQSLNDLIKNIISDDTAKSEGLRKEMLETLSTCKTEAGDDDCKLLQCIKVTELPFFEVLYTVVTTREMNMCFTNHGLKASDSQLIYQIKGPEDVQELLKTLDEDKLSCAIVCIYDKQVNLIPDESLAKKLETRINANEKLTDDQKKQILETLNKCATEAAGDNCKLVKCIKVLRAPFLNLYTKSKN